MRRKELLRKQRQLKAEQKARIRFIRKLRKTSTGAEAKERLLTMLSSPTLYSRAELLININADRNES